MLTRGLWVSPYRALRCPPTIGRRAALRPGQRDGALLEPRREQRPVTDRTARHPADPSSSSLTRGW
jgi:hypothetical protein